MCVVVRYVCGDFAVCGCAKHTKAAKAGHVSHPSLGTLTLKRGDVGSSDTFWRVCGPGVITGSHWCD